MSDAPKNPLWKRLLSWKVITPVAVAIALPGSYYYACTQVALAMKPVLDVIAVSAESYSRWQETKEQKDVETVRQAAERGYTVAFIHYYKMVGDGAQPNEVAPVLRKLTVSANDWELFGSLDVVNYAFDKADPDYGDTKLLQVGLTAAETEAYKQCYDRLKPTWGAGLPGAIAGVPVFTPYILLEQYSAAHNSCHDLISELNS